MELISKIFKVIAIIIILIGVIFLVGTIGKNDHEVEMRQAGIEFEETSESVFYKQLRTGIIICAIGAIFFALGFTINLLDEHLYKLRNKWSNDDPEIIVSSKQNLR